MVSLPHSPLNLLLTLVDTTLLNMVGYLFTGTARYLHTFFLFGYFNVEKNTLEEAQIQKTL